MEDPSMKRQSGFSLVELIVVIVLVGIIGGVLAMQLLPAVRAYLAVGERAALTHQADTALRRIVGDVRRAVPNSLRLGSSQCLQLVPSSDGGRFRNDQDYSPNASAAAFLDDTATRQSFDVLTPFVNQPAHDDAIVIGNQNPGDVHGRINVALVDTVGAPPAASMGTLRITLQPGTGLRVPEGYTGARFMVIPAAEQTVSYVCEQGKLYRIAYPDLQAAARCEVPATAPLLASGVTGCQFVYSANQGATQESGFVRLHLTLSGKEESVSLTLGAHVDNVP
jgi:MSHA biogenesis protein MshO